MPSNFHPADIPHPGFRFERFNRAMSFAWPAITFPAAALKAYIEGGNHPEPKGE